MAKKPGKEVQNHESLEKCKLQLEWDTTSVQKEWVNNNSKEKSISTAVKDAESLKSHMFNMIHSF